MTDEPENQLLSDAESMAIRRQRRRKDGGRVSNFLQRIGRPKPESFEDIDWGRHRFGQSMILVGCFLVIVVLALPNDDRRWLFFGLAWLTVLIGAHQIDKANRARGKK